MSGAAKESLTAMVIFRRAVIGWNGKDASVVRLFGKTPKARLSGAGAVTTVLSSATAAATITKEKRIKPWREIMNLYRCPSSCPGYRFAEERRASIDLHHAPMVDRFLADGRIGDCVRGPYEP